MKASKDPLLTIFNEVKKLIAKYEPPFIAKANYESRYALWLVKDIEIAGRKRKEVFFAGLIIQSNYVGFYFMPVYTNTEIKKMFKPELLKLLKGKSCFHLKTIDKELLKQIKEALKAGYDLYKKNEWV